MTCLQSKATIISPQCLSISIMLLGCLRVFVNLIESVSWSGSSTFKLNYY